MRFTNNILFLFLLLYKSIKTKTIDLSLSIYIYNINYILINACVLVDELKIVKSIQLINENFNDQKLAASNENKLKRTRRRTKSSESNTASKNIKNNVSLIKKISYLYFFYFFDNTNNCVSFNRNESSYFSWYLFFLGLLF